MVSNDAQIALRSALAYLYPSKADAERIATDAGLNTTLIDFSAKAINNWNSIVQEATKQNRLDALLKVVATEYGSNPDFQQAYQLYHQSIEPTINGSNGPTVSSGSTGPKSGRLVRILFLAANPRETPALQLDEEVRAIDQALRLANYRDAFDLETQWAVRYNELSGHLLRYQPDIVHFSGHGSSAGEIILLDQQGSSHLVSAQALGKLFALLKDNIRCVVLNACYSESQAQAIAQQIDTVVGMTTAIGDQAAISFATAFYQGLGYGRSVQTAFDLGCLQIDLANLSEQDTPKLLHSPGCDPTKLTLVQQTS
jgi:hypothetical protein